MKRFKPGVTFGDFVVTDVSMRKSRVADETPRDFRRGWLIWLAVVIVLGGLFLRLFYLQVILGGRYRILADENRIRSLVLYAPRGMILDRNGQVLAGNIREYYLAEPEKVQVEGWKREYPCGEACVAVTGYLGKLQDDEVGLLKTAGGKYETGAWIGRSGVEAFYEDSLRGNDGGRLIEVDNQGQIERELGRREPVQGRDLRTNLDINLQRVGYDALAGRKGAVVAMAPKTGAVLALVSSPGFKPEELLSDYSRISSDANLPLFNRAVSGTYAPGSTFKMVTVAAAVTSGKVDYEFTFRDEGVIRVAGFAYHNWLFTKNGGTEGVIGFRRALARSTDTFFYKVGEITGPETIAAWARRVGYEARTGIDLPGEAAGLIPDPEWKQEFKNEKWFLGNTYQMSIGQSDILATPLQVNAATGAYANKGRWCRPQIAVGGEPECRDLGISDRAMKLIEEGMIDACASGGTAFPLFDLSPKAACKTGTAEYYDQESGKIKTHAWLTAYAPVENPEIAVTAFVEGGGGGSNIAAPIVRKMLVKYFGVEDKYNYAVLERISE